MTAFWLKLTLLSDAAFSRGDGVAGLVDSEVQQDPFGFPYLGGKTLKGLLMAECAEILGALQRCASPAAPAMQTAAARLFGEPGSQDQQGSLHVGSAQLPADFRCAVEYENSQREPAKKTEILEALTTLRAQTALAPDGAPRRNSLRTIRVILRETPFWAKLDFITEPSETDLALLAACVKALRRAGAHRHRGLGRLQAELLDENQKKNVFESLFSRFERQVKK